MNTSAGQILILLFAVYWWAAPLCLLLADEDKQPPPVPEWMMKGLLSALDDPIPEVQVKAWTKFSELFRWRKQKNGEVVSPQYLLSEEIKKRFQPHFKKLSKLTKHDNPDVRKVAVEAHDTMEEETKSVLSQIENPLKDEFQSAQNLPLQAQRAEKFREGIKRAQEEIEQAEREQARREARSRQSQKRREITPVGT